MQFLAPLFLTALAAIGLPIVLHLVQREKRRTVAFPSLMFLRAIPHRSTRRRRLRDLPLLLLRVLALALLAAAFARPLLERGKRPAGQAGGAREVVLLLDRSYSMGYDDRWVAARRAALAEVDQIRPGDRMTIVAFDAGAAALAPATADRARLRAIIRELRPGSAVTRFDPALRLAADLLRTSRLPRREVVLVSDLQRSGAAGGLEARLPPGTELRTPTLPPATAADLAVAGVSFRRTSFGGQERVSASARVVNPSDVAVPGQRVTLELDGQTVSTASVSVAAHAAATVELPPFTLARPVRGRVRVGPDALAADDAFHFALAPGQALSVLVLDGRPGVSLFLRRALAVGGGPGFAVTAADPSLDAAALHAAEVVVLNGAAPGGPAARRLAEFVRQGGGLVVAVPPETAPAPELARMLPGRVGEPRDRTGSGGVALAGVDLSHPVFDVFRAPHSGDLTAPRFYRYRALELARAPADTGVTVLARFDDGAVALAERRIGRGRVLLWTSSLDRAWTDLPVHPLFVPLLQRLVAYASAYGPPPPARTVGEVVDAQGLARVGDDLPLLALAPDGSRLELPAGKRALSLEQSGFYTIRRRDADERVLATVAANVDVREAELAAWTPAAFAALVRTPGRPAAVAGSSATTPDERERRQALWRWLLLAGVAVLSLETLLSNRRARTRLAGSEAA